MTGPIDRAAVTKLLDEIYQLLDTRLPAVQADLTRAGAELAGLAGELRGRLAESDPDADQPPTSQPAVTDPEPPDPLVELWHRYCPPEPPTDPSPTPESPVMRLRCLAQRLDPPGRRQLEAELKRLGHPATLPSLDDPETDELLNGLDDRIATAVRLLLVLALHDDQLRWIVPERPSEGGLLVQFADPAEPRYRSELLAAVHGLPRAGRTDRPLVAALQRLDRRLRELVPVWPGPGGLIELRPPAIDSVWADALTGWLDALRELGGLCDPPFEVGVPPTAIGFDEARTKHHTDRDDCRVLRVPGEQHHRVLWPLMVWIRCRSETGERDVRGPALVVYGDGMTR